MSVCITVIVLYLAQISLFLRKVVGIKRGSTREEKKAQFQAFIPSETSMIVFRRFAIGIFFRLVLMIVDLFSLIDPKKGVHRVLESIGVLSCLTIGAAIIIEWFQIYFQMSSVDPSFIFKFEQSSTISGIQSIGLILQIQCIFMAFDTSQDTRFCLPFLLGTLSLCLVIACLSAQYLFFDSVLPALSKKLLKSDKIYRAFKKSNISLIVLFSTISVVKFMQAF